MNREKRGMPWRKPYDDTLSMEQKGQRAYEVRGSHPTLFCATLSCTVLESHQELTV